VPLLPGIDTTLLNQIHEPGAIAEPLKFADEEIGAQAPR
jgi:hypothetical protein